MATLPNGSNAVTRAASCAPAAACAGSCEMEHASAFAGVTFTGPLPPTPPASASVTVCEPAVFSVAAKECLPASIAWKV